MVSKLRPRQAKVLTRRRDGVSPVNPAFLTVGLPIYSPRNDEKQWPDLLSPQVEVSGNRIELHSLGDTLAQQLLEWAGVDHDRWSLIEPSVRKRIAMAVRKLQDIRILIDGVVAPDSVFTGRTSKLAEHALLELERVAEEAGGSRRNQNGTLRTIEATVHHPFAHAVWSAIVEFLTVEKRSKRFRQRAPGCTAKEGHEYAKTITAELNAELSKRFEVAAPLAEVASVEMLLREKPKDVAKRIVATWKHRHGFSVDEIARPDSRTGHRTKN